MAFKFLRRMPFPFMWSGIEWNLFGAGEFQGIWSVELVLWVFTKDEVTERRCECYV